MPLYEYLCTSCGRTFETMQSFRDAPLNLCDRCGGPLKRLISPPAVQFKGSGWYVTDYGRSGSSPKSEGPVQAEGGSKPDTAPADASPSPSKKDS